ncbi:VanZ family protein [Gynuella sp.]|uniref:VanZ family protein n=1 Tax=Gynuella sp. TaxID=2969146 RepID=UPI003D0D2DB5
MRFIDVPLRYRILVLLLILALCPFFFIGGIYSLPYPLLKMLRDGGHFVFFGLLTFFVLTTIKPVRRLKPMSLLLWMSLVALVIGGGIEWLQGGFGRDSDLGDVRRDLMGVWLVLFLLCRFEHPLRRWVFGIPLLLALLYEVVPAWQVWEEEQRIQHSLPVLVAVEHDADLDQMYGIRQLTREQAYRGDYSARVHFDADLHKGLMVYRFAHDWRGYQHFVFHAYNPAATQFRLYVAISDLDNIRYHRDLTDRYERSVILDPGWNTVTIDLESIEQAPHTRSMDMANITRINLFIWQQPPGDLFIDDMRLE